jgi:hypothetical protein
VCQDVSLGPVILLFICVDSFDKIQSLYSFFIATSPGSSNLGFATHCQLLFS